METVSDGMSKELLVTGFENQAVIINTIQGPNDEIWGDWCAIYLAINPTIVFSTKTEK